MASGAPVSDEMAQAPAFAQLRAYPVEKLVRQLGTKRLAAVLSRRQSGAGPVMTETSVITVEMPWLPATVRLLEPLEHSTCTCHSRAFCSHKAEALLYWQLEHGIADPASLQNAGTCGNSLELDRVRSVCQAVQQAPDRSDGDRSEPASRLLPVRPSSGWRLCATRRGCRIWNGALRGLHGEYAALFWPVSLLPGYRPSYAAFPCISAGRSAGNRRCGVLSGRSQAPSGTIMNRWDGCSSIFWVCGTSRAAAATQAPFITSGSRRPVVFIPFPTFAPLL